MSLAANKSGDTRARCCREKSLNPVGGPTGATAARRTLDFNPAPLTYDSGSIPGKRLIPELPRRK